MSVIYRRALKTCASLELAHGACQRAQEHLLTPSELGDRASQSWQPVTLTEISIYLQRIFISDTVKTLSQFRIFSKLTMPTTLRSSIELRSTDGVILGLVYILRASSIDAHVRRALRHLTDNQRIYKTNFLIFLFVTVFIDSSFYTTCQG